MREVSYLEGLLKKNASNFRKIIPLADTDGLLLIDFTSVNRDLTPAIISDTDKFCDYINQKLKAENCRYGIGGYNELRTVYTRSELFDAATAPSSLERGLGVRLEAEPRRLHLGIDIWGAAATPIFTPLGGVIHSFAFNNNYGDYGATIILQHDLEGVRFHTLYGHVSLKDINGLMKGAFVSMGEELAHFGEPHENGGWPPHLHFQIIQDMELMEGDYPGVCRYSEREKYLLNCPNPEGMLQLNQYLKIST